MAVKKITMPQLGESVTEGTISKWLVQRGDKINKYDPLAEVMTDKVNAEVPSSFAGTIKELVASEGDTVPVGQLICYIETEQEDSATSDSSTSANDIAVTDDQQEGNSPNQADKHRYSPAVLKLAREHGINLEHVSGSGKGGRITRKDLQQLISSGEIPSRQAIVEEKVRKQEASSSVEQSKESTKTLTKVNVAAGDVEIPVTGLRKTIAQNMVRSKQEVPHAWMMVEVDVTELVALRESLKEEFKKKEGFNLTYFAFFIKAVAQSLKEYPQLNSTWAGDKIIQKKDINLSIAVATDDALFVPVIKHADEKSIKGIAREITELAGKVRTGKLTTEDIQGGTFTVNNTGSFGSVQSMGIINYPQAAILQVESVVKRPVVMNNGMIAVRDMVNLCLSLDHRVLDGLIAGKFLNRVKAILESMTKEHTSIY